MVDLWKLREQTYLVWLETEVACIVPRSKPSESFTIESELTIDMRLMAHSTTARQLLSSPRHQTNLLDQDNRLSAAVLLRKPIGSTHSACFTESHRSPLD